MRSTAAASSSSRCCRCLLPQPLLPLLPLLPPLPLPLPLLLCCCSAAGHACTPQCCRAAACSSQGLRPCACAKSCILADRRPSCRCPPAGRQDFEFPAGCQRIKVTPDGQYIFASGYHPPQVRRMACPAAIAAAMTRQVECCCLLLAACRLPLLDLPMDDPASAPSSPGRCGATTSASCP